MKYLAQERLCGRGVSVGWHILATGAGALSLSHPA